MLPLVTRASCRAPAYGAGIGRGGWSPDGSRFAVADLDGRDVTVHDLPAGTTLVLKPTLDDGRRVWLNGVSWSADGEHLLSDAQSGPDSERGPFAQVSIALDGSVDVLSPWAYVKLPH